MRPRKIVLPSILSLLVLFSTGQGQSAPPTPGGKPTPAKPIPRQATSQPAKPDAFDQFVPPATQKELGLHKLTQDERAKLLSAITTLVATNDLHESAYAYMESEGFKKVTVHGTRSLKLDEFGFEEDYLIVEDSFGTLWACDDLIQVSRPGRYWAEVRAFGPTRIIDRNGVARRILEARQVR